MRSLRFVPLLLVALAIVVQGQTTPAQQAEALLGKVRESIGGETRVRAVRSLEITGKAHHRLTGGATTIGELKIDLMLPDRYLTTERTAPRPSVNLTILQAVNGSETWIDRQVKTLSRVEDQPYTGADGPTTTPPQIAQSTLGMGNVTAGKTTTRNSNPTTGSTTNERTLLGMRLPTAMAGQERDTQLERMAEETRAAKQDRPATNRRPGVEDPAVKSALEVQLRNDFVCLAVALLQNTPPSFPVTMTHGGTLDTEQGKIETIDLAGPEEFAARLFIDQKSARPAMISYRQLINPTAGYVVSGNADPAAPTQEIAVQLYFADYRPVDGILFPFQIVKAVNGVPVDEWKLEKFKLNPDLKAKLFEKKK